MAYLRGIVVRLRTGDARYAGTDDPLFLAVSGAAGGREFPLNARWFDDAERGTDVRYALGDVWDEAALVGVKRPVMAETDWNDPKLFYVGFEAIDRVALRKQGGRRPTDDDAYQLDSIEVQLFGDPGQRRTFRCTTAIWLGVRFGLQVWLPEVG
jgi:hypothetical protein